MSEKVLPLGLDMALTIGVRFGWTGRPALLVGPHQHQLVGVSLKIGLLFSASSSIHRQFGLAYWPAGSSVLGWRSTAGGEVPIGNWVPLAGRTFQEVRLQLMDDQPVGLVHGTQTSRFSVRCWFNSLDTLDINLRLWIATPKTVQRYKHQQKCTYINCSRFQAHLRSRILFPSLLGCFGFKWSTKTVNTLYFACSPEKLHRYRHFAKKTRVASMRIFEPIS